MLIEALDCPALAGGVTPLEDQEQALPSLLDPALNLEKLDLQLAFFGLVLGTAHLARIRVGLRDELLARGVLDSAAEFV